MLGHFVSERCIRVDKANIEVIERLMMHVYKLLKFLRKHSSQHQSFNPLIGLYILKLCLMLVIMLWGQY